MTYLVVPVAQVVAGAAAVLEVRLQLGRERAHTLPGPAHLSPFLELPQVAVTGVVAPQTPRVVALVPHLRPGLRGALQVVNLRRRPDVGRRHAPPLPRRGPHVGENVHLRGPEVARPDLALIGPRVAAPPAQPRGRAVVTCRASRTLSARTTHARGTLTVRRLCSERARLRRVAREVVPLARGKVLAPLPGVRGAYRLTRLGADLVVRVNDAILVVRCGLSIATVVGRTLSPRYTLHTLPL